MTIINSCNKSSYEIFSEKKRKKIDSRDSQLKVYLIVFKTLYESVFSFKLTAQDSSMDHSWQHLSHSFLLETFSSTIRLFVSGKCTPTPLELIPEDRVSVWDLLWATLTNRTKFIWERKTEGEEKRDRQRDGKSFPARKWNIYLTHSKLRSLKLSSPISVAIWQDGLIKRDFHVVAFYCLVFPSLVSLARSLAGYLFRAM